MSIYTEHGYANRKEYLKSLSEDYGIPLEVVYAIADVYGPNEDFDGLVTELEDLADSGAFDD